jgi:hypothetical protein
MFRKLKNGFAPNGAISQKFQTDRVRYEVVKLSAAISAQVRETGSAVASDSSSEGDLNDLDQEMIAALTELTTTELLYFHQLGEIGCYLASAYADEENDNQAQPDYDCGADGASSPSSKTDSESESEEVEPCLLARSASCAEPTQSRATHDATHSRAHARTQPIQSSVNQLSANLLIASGRVRQAILELATILGVSVTLFTPASFQDADESDRKRYYYGLIAHEVFVYMGGKGITCQNGEPYHQRRVQVLNTLCDISKMTWTLMNLCAMTNTFRFATDTPLFKTVKVDPIESVFGNNGWRPVLPVATATAAERIVIDDSDDVPSIQNNQHN